MTTTVINFSPRHTTVIIVDSKEQDGDFMKQRAFVAYCMRVTDGKSGACWELWRRFSEFFHLRSTLLKKYARSGFQIHNFAFPPKVWFRSRAAGTISSRQQLLERFLAQLLELDVPFPEVQEFLTVSDRTRTGQSALAISPPPPSLPPPLGASRRTRPPNHAGSLGTFFGGNASAPSGAAQGKKGRARTMAPMTGGFVGGHDSDGVDGGGRPPHRVASRSMGATSATGGGSDTGGGGGGGGGADGDDPSSYVWSESASTMAAAYRGDSPFIRGSTGRSRRRSFDETVVVGSLAGQSIMQGQTAHSAERRVARALHLERAVLSTLQQSKIAETELAKCVADYVKQSSSGGGDDGGPEAGNSSSSSSGDGNGAGGDTAAANSAHSQLRQPPATLHRLTTVLATLRNRQLSLTEKWERDEKMLSQVGLWQRLCWSSDGGCVMMRLDLLVPVAAIWTIE